MTDNCTRLAHARCPAILGENRDTPRKRSLHRRGKRSRCAVFEFNKSGRRVASIEFEGARLRQGTDALHRPHHVTKAIKHVDAHPGHATAAAFFLPKAPAVARIAAEPAMPVVAFPLHNLAKAPLPLEPADTS